MAAFTYVRKMFNVRFRPYNFFVHPAPRSRIETLSGSGWLRSALKARLLGFVRWNAHAQPTGAYPRVIATYSRFIASPRRSAGVWTPRTLCSSWRWRARPRRAYGATRSSSRRTAARPWSREQRREGRREQRVAPCEGLCRGQRLSRSAVLTIYRLPSLRQWRRLLLRID